VVAVSATVWTVDVLDAVIAPSIFAVLISEVSESPCAVGIGVKGVVVVVFCVVTVCAVASVESSVLGPIVAVVRVDLAANVITLKVLVLVVVAVAVFLAPVVIASVRSAFVETVETLDNDTVVAESTATCVRDVDVAVGVHPSCFVYAVNVLEYTVPGDERNR
jgi:hypothetical protein